VNRCYNARRLFQLDNLIYKRGSAVKLHDSVEVILRHKGSQVYSISPNVTVYKALEVLAAKDIGALVVMNGDELVGLMSERDYVRKVILKGFSSKKITVENIMSSPVIGVKLKTTVDECMHLMTEERCRHLPVVEDGRVIGVVSIGDLVNWIMDAQDHTIHELEDYICGKYPA
jgi:CBS domain-containing protein